jgi:hypothetical protein
MTSSSPHSSRHIAASEAHSQFILSILEYGSNKKYQSVARVRLSKIAPDDADAVVRKRSGNDSFSFQQEDLSEVASDLQGFIAPIMEDWEAFLQFLTTDIAAHEMQV